MKKILIAILAITIVQSIFSQERISELSFEYEASSRGFYQRIKVEKGILFFFRRTEIKVKMLLLK